MTRKKFIEDRLAEGFKVEAKEVPDVNATQKVEEEIKRIKETYIPGLSNPNTPKAKRYAELKEMLDKGITKTEYRILTSGDSYYVITKTEYDYAKSIEGKAAAEIVPTGKTVTAKTERGTAIEAEKPKPKAKGKPAEPFSMTNRTMQPFPTKKDPLSLFNKTIPKKHTITALENLVVRDGIAYGTNLEITVAAKTDLEDGAYKITGKEGSLKTVKVDGDLDEYPDMSIKIEEDAPRDVLDIGKLRPALQRSLDYVGDDKAGQHLKIFPNGKRWRNGDSGIGCMPADDP